MVAIVGPSGAGKSTVSRILLRFYDVAGGRVTIDGQDIRDVTQASLRAAHRRGAAGHRAVQRHHPLQHPLRPARGHRRGGARGGRAWRRSTRSSPALPEGYRTMVGERGLKLSGGEKQRVAIARTILKGPPILLLDEATSALDSHTEKEIQDALDQVSRNRTTVVIAHRLSTIVGADNILVLDAGPAGRAGHARRAAGQGRPLRQPVEPAAPGREGARGAGRGARRGRPAHQGRPALARRRRAAPGAGAGRPRRRQSDCHLQLEVARTCAGIEA